MIKVIEKFLHLFIAEKNNIIIITLPTKRVKNKKHFTLYFSCGKLSYKEYD